MLLTQLYRNKRAVSYCKTHTGSGVNPQTVFLHTLAQRQTRANNHLQTRTERPVSLLSPEHQTLKICRQEQLRILSTGVPWQNNPEVKHRGLQTLSIQKMGKWSNEGLYVEDYRSQFKGNMSLSMKGNTQARLRRWSVFTVPCQVSWWKITCAALVFCNELFPLNFALMHMNSIYMYVEDLH